MIINSHCRNGSARCNRRIGKCADCRRSVLNLVGDYGGGGMLLALGITLALLEAQHSGEGQVVDAAMTDGSALLMAKMYGVGIEGKWRNLRGANLLDGGAPDFTELSMPRREMGVHRAIEPRNSMPCCLKNRDARREIPQQLDPSLWPSLKEKLAAVFRNKDPGRAVVQDHGKCDVCFAPVLDMNEAPEYPHNKKRGTFLEIDGIVQPAPAPRFGRTIPEVQGAPARNGEHTSQILKQHGYSEKDIELLKINKVI